MKFDFSFFNPKIADTLGSYSKEKFLKDLMAGIIVGIVALPLAIAFGIASGVSPEKGIYTAIIAGFIISLLGGSKVQIGGPTGAFIVIVYGIVQEFGLTGLAIATIIAGIMLVMMGVLKLGVVIKFIPFPVIVGFTSGIALTIFATQIKDLFGMHIEKVPSEFIDKWGVYAEHVNTTNLWALGVGILTVIIISITPKFTKVIPGSLIAIVLMTVVVMVLKNSFGIIGIETIGDRFSINPSLPKLESFQINMEIINTLMPAAFTIAMLGAIESLLSATVADGVIGDKHDSNTELIAQGVANIITPIFGGIPATGAIARTMTNINNGGKTPIAGIIHAIVLLLILLFLGDLTKHIPMACLAGVLVVVAYNMSEWRTFRSLLKGNKSDVSVLIATFALTVIFDLTVAIEIGLILALVLFLRRTSETSNISVHTGSYTENTELGKNDDINSFNLKKGVEVYEIEGPFFFGTANKFEETMKTIGDKPKVRILRMRKVPFIDSTGIHNLKSLIKYSDKEKTKIILSGVNDNVYNSLTKGGIVDFIGTKNVLPNIQDAVKRSEEIISENSTKG